MSEAAASGICGSLARVSCGNYFMAEDAGCDSTSVGCATFMSCVIYYGCSSSADCVITGTLTSDNL